MKTYSELIKFDTFKDRYEYLRLDGTVCEETFGYDRYLNQLFYRSLEWKDLRNKIILRDLACDMALSDHEIGGRIFIHHMNPILIRDISNRNPEIMDPEYLVCVSFATHNAIHYGSWSLLTGNELVERLPYDTCPWK